MFPKDCTNVFRTIGYGNLGSLLLADSFYGITEEAPNDEWKNVLKHQSSLIILNFSLFIHHSNVAQPRKTFQQHDRQIVFEVVLPLGDAKVMHLRSAQFLQCLSSVES